MITLPDERWAHPHIKSLQLLPNVLAKQAAREAGAFEAWFVDADGFVTEGASTNAWIVTADGVAGHAPGRSGDPARGHPLDADRRRRRRKAFAFEERPFTREEAYRAPRGLHFQRHDRSPSRSSPSTGGTIGDGRPGPVAMALRRKFTRRGGAHAQIG